jgi:hypothetical protein
MTSRCYACKSSLQVAYPNGNPLVSCICENKQLHYMGLPRNDDSDATFTSRETEDKWFAIPRGLKRIPQEQRHEFLSCLADLTPANR